MGNRNIYFPKKSHHGYFDPIFQRCFSSKSEKREFMNKHGFVEGDPVSKEHMKRVNDFNAWVKDERRKNPDFEPKKERYPD